MKYFIITYENNLDFAEKTKLIMNKNFELDPEIIVGNSIDEVNKRTQVCMSNWVDHILPKAIESKEDIIVFEDDVRLIKPIHTLQFDDYDIIWFGYRRGRLEQKKKAICGTQALYIKKEVLKDLYDNFLNYKKYIHVDRAFSKFCIQFQNKYKINQTKLSYVYEEQHTSLISLDKWDQYTKPHNTNNNNNS